VSCLSLRLKSTGNNLGETEVFNAVRHGFAAVKLQVRKDRGLTKAKSWQMGPMVSGGTVLLVAIEGCFCCLLKVNILIWVNLV